MVLNKGGSTTKSLISLGIAFRPKSLRELLLDDVSTPAAVPTLTSAGAGTWSPHRDAGACTQDLMAFGPGMAPLVLSWVLPGTRSHRRT